MWGTWATVLLLATSLAIGHDGWTTDVAGCDEGSSRQVAETCAALSRRIESNDAAVLSARAFILSGDYPQARAVLSSFETSGDPQVLYRLGWLDGMLGQHELALAEFRRALEAAERQADRSVVAKVKTRFAYLLYQTSHYAEAVQMLDALLVGPPGTLTLSDERDARLRLARALNYLGDGPAAEAELRRLKQALGATPPSALELLFEAQLQADDDQLRSADELLQQAQLAARREGRPTYEAGAVINRVSIAADEANWVQLRALAAQARGFPNLQAMDRGELAFLEGIAARGEHRLEESRRLLTQALELLPPNRRWEVQTELGLTVWRLGDVEAAITFLEEAISQIETQRNQLGNTSLRAVSTGNRESPFDALFEIYAEAGNAEAALATLQRSLAGRLVEQVAEASNGAGHRVSDALDRSAAAQKLNEATHALTGGESASSRNARYVAFVRTETHSWALVHSAEGLQLVSVKLAPDTFCALMKKFGDGFDDDAGRQLGAEMFPASTLGRLGPRFAIILPSCARGFPVAAVPLGEGRLVDRAVVSIAPDVSAAAVRRTGESPRGGVVLADPFQDLPAARTEAEWTGRLTGAEVRLGEAASQAALANSGGHLLHFATHTLVEVAGPALVLADRNVTVADILQRRLHADLVVLASCHSGTQLKTTAAETLSTAFLRAGSHAVFATLRSVEDAFAFEVVRAFYLQGGLDDPAGALAKVQRQLARSEPPARWAAFFVAGSPGAVDSPRLQRQKHTDLGAAERPGTGLVDRRP